MELRTLSLCSGIGALDLGIKLAVPQARTVCYVERESFCQATLVVRMEEAALDSAPIWDDLKTFDGKPWRGRVDCITGGYPCQPFSVAGSRRGAEDPRHLWPDIKRITEEVVPEIVFFENVSGHLSLGFEEVILDLEGLGYRIAAGLFTAAEVGAPHERKRLFILGRLMADTDCELHDGGRGHRTKGRLESANSGSNVAHAKCFSDERRGESRELGRETEKTQSQRNQWQRGRNATWNRSQDGEMGNSNRARLEGWLQSIGQGSDKRPTWPSGPKDDAFWGQCPEEAQPAICGVVDGASLRVDRLRALGNSVVPAQAALAFRTLVASLSNIF